MQNRVTLPQAANTDAVRDEINNRLSRLYGVEAQDFVALRSGELPQRLRKNIALRTLLATFFYGALSVVLGTSALRLAYLAFAQHPGQFVAAALFLGASFALAWFARRRWLAATRLEMAMVSGTGYTGITLGNRTSSGQSRHHWLRVGGMDFGVTRSEFRVLEDERQYRVWYLKADRQVIAMEAIDE